MPLDSSLLSILAVAGVVLGGLGLLVAAGAHRRLRRLRRSLVLLQSGGDGESFLAAASRSAAEVATLDTAVRRLQAHHDELRAALGGAVRHVAVVRYDAFADLGGRLSFSVALLDDAADGVVLTSITGRSETRSYAKAVAAGGSAHALSPEEQQAIAAARAPATRMARHTGHGG